jgi:hypothetical protein
MNHIIHITSIVKHASKVYNCKNCVLAILQNVKLGFLSVELSGTAREIRGDLYCLRCHDKMQIPICAACHRPIDGEIVINALGKQWHMEVSSIFLSQDTSIYKLI